MAFARLAPHCGLTPVYGHHVGNCELRGGFSWGNIGSTLASGFRNVGSFIGNTAQRIGNSDSFQQAKQGILNSGIIENVGTLAGQTLNSLVDIGRLKLEQDLMKLQERTLGIPTNSGTVPPLTQEQLAQLLAATNTSKIPITPSPVTDPVVVTPAITTTETFQPPYLPPSDPVVTPVVDRTIQRQYVVPRKRRRVRGWGAALDDMTGGRVAYDSAEYCY